MQKTIGLVRATVLVTRGKPDSYQRILENLSKKKIRIRRADVSTGRKNDTNTMTLDLEYGPVAGAWPSDITKMVNSSIDAAGSYATSQIITHKRDIVEYR